MTSASETWLRVFRRCDAATLRLVCFPHAGGGASFFRSWAVEAPPGVEVLAVQYPGREDRILDPLIGEMAELADAITPALVACASVPMVLFGHSLGACVAYEVARRLSERVPARVLRLVVSGRPSPRVSGASGIHTRDELGIVAELVRMDERARVLLEDADLRALVIPAVREDYHLDAHYRAGPEQPLTCPIVALVGSDDGEATPEQMRDWRDFTQSEFTLEVLPGGHFYLVAQRRQVVHEVLLNLPGSPSAAPRWLTTP